MCFAKLLFFLFCFLQEEQKGKKGNKVDNADKHNPMEKQRSTNAPG